MSKYIQLNKYNGLIREEHYKYNNEVSSVIDRSTGAK